MGITEEQQLLSRFESAFDFAQQQVRALIERHPDYFPMYTVVGKWKHEGELWTNWCEGFLPGMMWIFHEETQDSYWRRKAEHYSRHIEPRKNDRNVHDLGFLFYHGTYRRWYDATARDGRPDQDVREVVFHAGRTLALRFRERGAYLRSFVADESLFIDIMMNVPIILYTAIETGDDALLKIASRHCATSRRFLVRGDGSTAHEAFFDPETGECLRQSTHQGYRGDSCWSRGLAWAIYGFATSGRLLNFGPWLETSRQCAQYLVEKLSGDPVPPWDFDAPPETLGQKDSSAAAIAASGLFELAEAEQVVGTNQARQRHDLADTALRILDALCQPAYLARDDPGWEGILKHGVYHLHKGLGVDESVMWGEFFFAEALHRAIQHLRARRDSRDGR
jgi:unsaturated chondroitin disaccharide hydrolase